MCVGTWPPALGMFRHAAQARQARRVADDGRRQQAEPSRGSTRSTPTSTRSRTCPRSCARAKRYRDCGDFSIAGVAAALRDDFGEGASTSSSTAWPTAPRSRSRCSRPAARATWPRVGVARTRWSRWCSTSARSCAAAALPVAVVHGRASGSCPGYGGGMSSAKAALECDTRVLAYEAGRGWGHRVNVISAGPYASRAAVPSASSTRWSTTPRATRPSPSRSPRPRWARPRRSCAARWRSGITGATVYVDKGYAAMGVAVDREGPAPTEG